MFLPNIMMMISALIFLFLLNSNPMIASIILLLMFICYSLTISFTGHSVILIFLILIYISGLTIAFMLISLNISKFFHAKTLKLPSLAIFLLIICFTNSKFPTKLNYTTNSSSINLLSLYSNMALLFLLISFIMAASIFLISMLMKKQFYLRK
uniref:NADH dehydrogenase subunit 6 n=1 Tax=Gnathostomula paradoxa TaxID=66783 RepID=A0A0F6Q2U7_9BILA|nr:NADH dehydrogenase subunit 6 [Gnathostomula paradoxa]AKD00032.1 NADH dehydrogenase subunit 6 [Gnathostomula paradoxa]